jgi:hypothetical protein
MKTVKIELNFEDVTALIKKEVDVLRYNYGSTRRCMVPIAERILELCKSLPE